MTPEELRQRAEAVSWWHGGMDLGHGVITKGVVNPAVTLLPRLDLPDVQGKTVLDIGAWDGYMCWECERRGAIVTAVDSFEWTREDNQIANPTGMDGFNLAHEAYQSKVRPVFCEVLNLDPFVWGTFDVVLFLGVLYHMQHPLLALQRAANMVAPGGLLIIETHTAMNDVTLPAMRFYPGRELGNDKTNWWGPNLACVEAMMCTVGLVDIRQVGLWGDRAVFHGRRNA